MNNVYTIIPNQLLSAPGLSVIEKVLLCAVISLSRNKGYCYATNSYFSKLMCISERSISNSINKLKQHGYISFSINDNYKRNIYVNYDILEKHDIPIPEPPEKTSKGLEKSSTPLENSSNPLENSSTYNNNYNKINNNNYNFKKTNPIDKPSYDLAELMKIK
ncbi:MAG: helix-turn-helix domain-containing protein [Ruminococcus sp.]|nr:helix-turn-helix domain-containing protein [Ruminococcus sp.]